MADIIQTLGFDASGAITAINQLNTALGTLNTKLIEVAQTARVINGLGMDKTLQKMATASAAAGAGVGALGNNAANGLNKASASANKFVLSLETISRIALAQVLVRAFGTIQQQMSEAIQTAEKFNTLLAETVAVSPRGLEDFQGQVVQLKGELIEASNAFGFDILDVTNAKLQEFQNQVKGSATNTALFTSALKLARISGSDVTQTVDALSSVLNSYGQGVEQADSVSAALFKTVEVGRVQLKDIADELGNVTPLARAAGISFNEVAASLARITQSGVSPSRALTQVKSLINQLQKPTKELSTIFRDVLNISGLEEGIQRFGGLKNLLDAINTELAGNAQRTAAAFNEIKAQNAFELLTQDSEKFADALDKIGEASQKSTAFLDELLEKFNAQDAVQFRIAITNLNNEFLQLADKSLPLLTRFINGLSVSLNNLNATFQNVAAVGLAVYSTRMIAAVGITKTLNAEAGLAGKVGIFGLGVAIGVVINQLARYIDKSAVAAEQAKILASVEGPKQNAFKAIDESASKAIKDFETLSTEGTKALAAIAKASEATSKQFLAANNAFVANIEGSLDNLLDGRGKLVTKLEKLIGDAEGNITKNHQEQTGIREKISDREFQNRTAHLDALRQSFLQNQRAQEELAKAQRNDTRGAGTDEGLKERLRLLERAEKIAEESASTAASTGNRAAVAKAEQTITEILNAQLSIKKQQEALDLAQAKIAKDNLASQKANFEQLKDAVKDFKDNVSLFKNNQLISPEQRDEAEKRAKEALQKIEKFALEGKGLSIAEFLGVTGLRGQLEAEFNNVKVNFTGTREQLLDTIEKTVQGQVAQVPVKFIVQQGEQLGIDLKDIDVLEPLASLEEALAKVKTTFAESTEADKQFARANEETAAAIEVVRGLLDTFSGGEAIGRLQEAFTALSSKTFTTSQDIERFIAVIQELDDRGEIDLPGTEFFGGEVDAINGVIDALGRLQTAQQQALGARQAAPQGRTQELKDLQALLTGQLQLQQKADQFKQSIAQSGQQASVLDKNIEAGVQSSDQMNAKYRALISLIEQATREQEEFNRKQGQAPGIPAPTAPRSRMFGGMMQYFSNGGWVRGTDSILAALSPGETVVNPRASRQFAPQIAAMNAGVQPVYRAEGGPVVNNTITVGDINVNGAVGPVATGRSVVAELRREFRRGTSSRFR